jgi:hypothetical protein
MGQRRSAEDHNNDAVAMNVRDHRSGSSNVMPERI